MVKKKEMTVKDRIIDIVRDRTAADVGITENWKLIDDCGADSLDLVEIVMQIEDEFGLEIPDEDADRMITVGDIINYIEEQLKQ